MYLAAICVFVCNSIEYTLLTSLPDIQGTIQWTGRKEYIHHTPDVVKLKKVKEK